MFIDKNSVQLKIGNDFVNIGDYITDAKFEYNKLWADAGRNLAGKMTSTFVGIFPKITLNFGRLTKSEFELLSPTLNAPRQIIKYYDPDKKALVQMNTYTNDLGLSNRNLIDETHTNEPFSISFIAIERRA